MSLQSFKYIFFVVFSCFWRELLFFDCVPQGTDYLLSKTCKSTSYLYRWSLIFYSHSSWCEDPFSIMLVPSSDLNQHFNKFLIGIVSLSSSCPRNNIIGRNIRKFVIYQNIGTTICFFQVALLPRMQEPNFLENLLKCACLYCQ